MATKLYPPQLEGTLPAFYKTYDEAYTLQGATITVAFGLSKAVAISDIKSIIMRMRTTSTNTQKIVKEATGFNITTDLVAYFTLDEKEAALLNEGQYYRIQLAFIGQNDEIGYYSTVGVIKCIAKPKDINIKGFSPTTINMFDSEILGVYQQDTHWGDTTEKEYSYRFIVWDENDQELVNSGWLLHDTTQDIESDYSTDRFKILKELKEGEIGSVEYSVITVNGLELSTYRYKIMKTESVELEYPLQLFTTNNFEDGCIELTMRGDYTHGVIGENEVNGGAEATYSGTFVITRTDERSDYTEWVEICRFIMAGDAASHYGFRDFTVQQGVRYRYGIQQYNINYIYSQKTLSYDITPYLETANPMYEAVQNNTGPVTADFEDMFLFDGQRQLKIRYNPKVTSFKNTIPEQKLETIGSKYPFIFRNGHTKYKEFPIAGLLSFSMDESALFLTDDEINDSRIVDYDKIRTTSAVSPSIASSAEERNFKVQYIREVNPYTKVLETKFLYIPYTDKEKNVEHKNIQNIVYFDPTESMTGRVEVNAPSYDFKDVKGNSRLEKIAGVVRQDRSLSTENMMGERFFKLAVLEWLTDGKVKLFRSPAEGNYLVRLLNVSMTPQDPLGRMLHQFTCQGYEIDDLTYDNLIYYGIVTNEVPTISTAQWKSIDLRKKLLHYANEDTFYKVKLGTDQPLTLDFNDFMPGDTIQITYAEEVEPIEYVIGRTGNFIVDTEERTIIGIAIKPNPNFDGEYDPAEYSRLLTYSYISLATSRFDAIQSIFARTQTAEQFVGPVNDLLTPFDLEPYDAADDIDKIFSDAKLQSDDEIEQNNYIIEHILDIHFIDGTDINDIWHTNGYATELYDALLLILNNAKMTENEKKDSIINYLTLDPMGYETEDYQKKRILRSLQAKTNINYCLGEYAKKFTAITLEVFHARKRPIVPIYACENLMWDNDLKEFKLCKTEGIERYDDGSIKNIVSPGTLFSMTPFGIGYVNSQTIYGINNTYKTIFKANPNPNSNFINTHDITPLTVEEIEAQLPLIQDFNFEGYSILKVYLPDVIEVTDQMNGDIILTPRATFTEHGNLNEQGWMENPDKNYLYFDTFTHSWWDESIEYDTTFSLTKLTDSNILTVTDSEKNTTELSVEDLESMTIIDLNEINEITIREMKAPDLIRLGSGVMAEISPRLQVVDYNIESSNSLVYNAKLNYINAKTKFEQLLHDSYGDSSELLAKIQKYEELIRKKDEIKDRIVTINNALTETENLGTALIERLTSYEKTMYEMQNTNLQQMYNIFSNLVYPTQSYGDGSPVAVAQDCEDIIDDFYNYAFEDPTGGNGYQRNYFYNKKLKKFQYTENIADNYTTDAPINFTVTYTPLEGTEYYMPQYSLQAGEKANAIQILASGVRPGDTEYDSILQGIFDAWNDQRITDFDATDIVTTIFNTFLYESNPEIAQHQALIEQYEAQVTQKQARIIELTTNINTNQAQYDTLLQTTTTLSNQIANMTDEDAKAILLDELAELEAQLLALDASLRADRQEKLELQAEVAQLQNTIVTETRIINELSLTQQTAIMKKIRDALVKQFPTKNIEIEQILGDLETSVTEKQEQLIEELTILLTLDEFVDKIYDEIGRIPDKIQKDWITEVLGLIPDYMYNTWVSDLQKEKVYYNENKVLVPIGTTYNEHISYVQKDPETNHWIAYTPTNLEIDEYTLQLNYYGEYRVWLAHMINEKILLAFEMLHRYNTLENDLNGISIRNSIPFLIINKENVLNEETGFFEYTVSSININDHPYKNILFIANNDHDGYDLLTTRQLNHQKYQDLCANLQSDAIEHLFDLKPIEIQDYIDEINKAAYEAFTGTNADGIDFNLTDKQSQCIYSATITFDVENDYYIQPVWINGHGTQESNGIWEYRPSFYSIPILTETGKLKVRASANRHGRLVLFKSYTNNLDKWDADSFDNNKTWAQLTDREKMSYVNSIASQYSELINLYNTDIANQGSELEPAAVRDEDNPNFLSPAKPIYQVIERQSRSWYYDEYGIIQFTPTALINFDVPISLIAPVATSDIIPGDIVDEYGNQIENCTDFWKLYNGLLSDKEVTTDYSGYGTKQVDQITSDLKNYGRINALTSYIKWKDSAQEVENLQEEYYDWHENDGTHRGTKGGKLKELEVLEDELVNLTTAYNTDRYQIRAAILILAAELSQNAASVTADQQAQLLDLIITKLLETGIGEQELLDFCNTTRDTTVIDNLFNILEQRDVFDKEEVYIAELDAFLAELQTRENKPFKDDKGEVYTYNTLIADKTLCEKHDYYYRLRVDAQRSAKLEQLNTDDFNYITSQLKVIADYGKTQTDKYKYQIRELEEILNDTDNQTLIRQRNFYQSQIAEKQRVLIELFEAYDRAWDKYEKAIKQQYIPLFWNNDPADLGINYLIANYQDSLIEHANDMEYFDIQGILKLILDYQNGREEFLNLYCDITVHEPGTESINTFGKADNLREIFETNYSILTHLNEVALDYAAAITNLKDEDGNIDTQLAALGGPWTADSIANSVNETSYMENILNTLAEYLTLLGMYYKSEVEDMFKS